MPSKKLALGIILTFLLTITYQSIAGYLTSPYTGLKYPNPGHYANEIGPGTFFCDISDLPNCFWKFPAKVIIEGTLNLTRHDIIGVSRIYASVFMDKDNSTYYFDPNLVSRLFGLIVDNNLHVVGKIEASEIEADKVNASKICLNEECKSSWLSSENVVCRVNKLNCYWTHWLYDFAGPAICKEDYVAVGGEGLYSGTGNLWGLRFKCCEEVCGKPAKLSEYFYNITGKTRSKVNAEIASKEPGYHWCTLDELRNIPYLDLISGSGGKFWNPGDEISPYDRNDYGAVDQDTYHYYVCSSKDENCHWVSKYACPSGYSICDDKCVRKYTSGCSLPSSLCEDDETLLDYEKLKDPAECSTINDCGYTSGLVCENAGNCSCVSTDSHTCWIGYVIWCQKNMAPTLVTTRLWLCPD